MPGDVRSENLTIPRSENSGFTQAIKKQRAVGQQNFGQIFGQSCQWFVTILGNPGNRLKHSDGNSVAVLGVGLGGLWPQPQPR